MQEPNSSCLFQWIEIDPRPLKDGLHDSGYRFLRLTGVSLDQDGKEVRTPLHQWSDHAIFLGPVNIDTTSDGRMRIMLWSQGQWDCEDARHGLFVSTAVFHVPDFKDAARTVEVLNEVHYKALRFITSKEVDAL